MTQLIKLVKRDDEIGNIARNELKRVNPRATPWKVTTYKSLAMHHAKEDLPDKEIWSVLNALGEPVQANLTHREAKRVVSSGRRCARTEHKNKDESYRKPELFYG